MTKGEAYEKLDSEKERLVALRKQAAANLQRIELELIRVDSQLALLNDLDG